MAGAGNLAKLAVAPEFTVDRSPFARLCNDDGAAGFSFTARLFFTLTARRPSASVDR